MIIIKKEENMNLEGIEGEQSGINDRNINDRNIKVV